MTAPLDPEELRRRFEDVAAGPTVGDFDDILRRASRRRRFWRGGLLSAAVVAVAVAVVVPVVLTSSGGATQHLVVLPATTATPRSLPTMLPLPHRRPATLAAMVGRWRAVHPTPGGPRGYVQFSPHGTWSGVDGCNTLGGNISVLPAGVLRLGAVASTLVGCAGPLSPEPGWLTAAKYASFIGSRLFLNRPNGNLLGELMRTTAPPPLGQVQGKFGWAGGPAPGTGQPLSGAIAVHFGTAKGRVVARTRAVDGPFTISLAPGRYVFVGTSHAPNWVCSSPVTTVRADREVRVNVLCQVA